MRVCVYHIHFLSTALVMCINMCLHAVLNRHALLAELGCKGPSNDLESVWLQGRSAQYSIGCC